MKNLKNFSVLVKNSGASQLSFYIINQLNKMSEENPDIDAILFYENRHKNCLPANFSVMQISEARNQLGPVIATSFYTAYKLIDFTSNQKLFYVWDLEWIRSDGAIIKQYESYKSVYTDPSLELIARSSSHKSVIENAFNREVKYIVEDFNFSKILEILK